tara:strand:+ start:1288 stop:1548 length:261 start_codon:yes stop_codon:yes gene_type:complete
MIDRRIDLKQLEEDALMEDLNWSIARFEQVEKLVKNMIAELKRCYEELNEHDKLVGFLVENHFVETSPYETVKHLIETHQDYRASE